MRPPHYRARKSENQREREETLFGQIFQRDGSVGAQFGVVGC
jgi:hypothetical protein